MWKVTFPHSSSVSKNAQPVILTDSLVWVLIVNLFDIFDRFCFCFADELDIAKHFFFKKNQYYIIQLDKTLEPGQILIKMSFEAFLTNSLKGLYKSEYQRANGKNV